MSLNNNISKRRPLRDKRSPWTISPRFGAANGHNGNRQVVVLGGRHGKLVIFSIKVRRVENTRASRYMPLTRRNNAAAALPLKLEDGRLHNRACRRPAKRNSNSPLFRPLLSLISKWRLYLFVCWLLEWRNGSRKGACRSFGGRNVFLYGRKWERTRHIRDCRGLLLDLHLPLPLDPLGLLGTRSWLLFVHFCELSVVAVQPESVADFHSGC